jgi:hypothetical protein
MRKFLKFPNFQHFKIKIKIMRNILKIPNFQHFRRRTRGGNQRRPRGMARRTEEV